MVVSIKAGVVPIEGFSDDDDNILWTRCVVMCGRDVSVCLFASFERRLLVVELDSCLVDIKDKRMNKATVPNARRFQIGSPIERKARLHINEKA